MTTRDYKNAKVYKIEAINGEEGDIYIGSTTKKYLSQRLAAHLYEYKQWKSGSRHKYSCFDIFEKYGVDNCKMILLENVDTSHKDELYAREAFYIKELKCVNKMIPQRTHAEYNRENKEIILERKKLYYKNNKVILNEKK